MRNRGSCHEFQNVSYKRHPQNKKTKTLKILLKEPYPLLYLQEIKQGYRLQETLAKDFYSKEFFNFSCILKICERKLLF